MTDIKNNVGDAMDGILGPIIREVTNKVYEREKAKAIKELEIAFECAKVDLLAACAVEIRHRTGYTDTDTEIVIKVRR